MSLFSRLFGRRPQPPEPPEVLLDRAMREVTDEFRSLAPTLEGPDLRGRLPPSNPFDLWFMVATNDYLESAKQIGLPERLDATVRDRLARNGFLRATGAAFFVSLHSRQAIDEVG